jgi:hypothetical protein
MRVRSVRWFVGRQKAEVVVDDETSGVRRIIDYEWKSKDPSPIPETWYESIKGEVEFQRSEELKKAKGLSLPGIR